MRSGYVFKDSELKLVNSKGFHSLLPFYEAHPTYVYNLESIKQRISSYQTALKGVDSKIHYAVKANSHDSILSLMKDSDCGIDVVSAGEVKKCLEVGSAASDIIFSGIGKSHDEISFAIKNSVGQINVESLGELKRIQQISNSLKKNVNIGLRLNPDIPVKTHPYIATGFRENKFGVALSQIPEALVLIKDSKYISWTSIGAHIGSQILDLDPLKKSMDSLKKIYSFLKNQEVALESIDLGGGLGVDYRSDDEELDFQNIQNYGKLIQDTFKDSGIKIILEPGRSLVARSGVLLMKVEYIKNNGFKNFVIVNSGMHHMLRPALYQAFHRIQPLKTKESENIVCDIVGPICESSDVLGFDRQIPKPEEGDLLALRDAGAYGASMSSNYNLHGLAKEIVV